MSTLPYHTSCYQSTINREPSVKTTVPRARLHTDSWGPFPVGSITGGCRMFVTLIDETTGRSRLRPTILKSKVKSFLIHKVRTLVVEDRKPVVVIRTIAVPLSKD